MDKKRAVHADRPLAHCKKIFDEKSKVSSSKHKGLIADLRFWGEGLHLQALGGGGWMRRRRDCRFKAASGRAWEERLQI